MPTPTESGTPLRSASIRGHDAVAERFRRSLAKGRLASTYLFIGPPGVGKRTFAMWLAQSLLCEQVPDTSLRPCGVCASCQQVAAASHPDVILVSKPEDRAFIPVEVFIGDREHRMREGLCHDISLKPFCGGHKIAIIDDADFLNEEGANCLLKTLEEPPPGSLIMLIGTSEQRQLPTIRSRCQVIRFGALRDQDVAELLIETGIVSDPEEADRQARLGGGSIRQAIDLADGELMEFREHLLDQLAGTPTNLLRMAPDVVAFVDHAGKENAARRNRLRRVLGMACEYYRGLMLALNGIPVHGDDRLQSAVERGSAGWPTDDEAVAACLDRCLDAESHTASNAVAALVIECWLDELGRLAAGQPLPASTMAST